MSRKSRFVFVLVNLILAASCSGKSPGKNENTNLNNNNGEVCGNGVIDSGEECDGELLGGATCQTEGFTGGNLSCSESCTYDTSECVDCVDEDGDGYGIGADCFGDDCDDSDPDIWTGCPVTDLIKITAGHFHACAIKFDGTVWCWGANYYGQLGDGTNTDSSTPVQVSGLSEMESIDSYSEHTCAVRSDRTAWCWGYNSFGQLGDGTTSSSNVPVQILSEVVAVGTGFNHSCAVLSDGSVSCWGLNFHGQFGNGTTTDSLVPVELQAELSDAVSISAGHGHTCAVCSDETAWCWGDNSEAQLGDGTTTNSLVPVQVLESATSVAAGYDYTCAAKTDGTAWCWGNNIYGKLGDGTETNSATPVQVLGLTNVVKVAVQAYHTCALGLDGTAWCWGLNYAGQLGDGTTVNSTSPLEVIIDSSDFLDLATGHSGTCAIQTFDGSGLCWGNFEYH